MGCLKLTYQPVMQVLRTRKSVQSREAKVVQMWLSVDPLAEVQPNKTPYHYTSNNPINRIDPTGMLDEPTPKEAAMIAKHVYGDKKDPGYLKIGRASCRERV